MKGFKGVSITGICTVQQKIFPEHVDPTAGNVLEVVYPNGVKVRVPIGTDPTQLRSLILLIR